MDNPSAEAVRSEGETSLSDLNFADGTRPPARRTRALQTESAQVSNAAGVRRGPALARGSQDIFVEIADGRKLAEIQPSWIALLERSDEPNVFMDPALVRVAADVYPKTESVALLAWRKDGARSELVGVWAFAVGSARHSALPVRILTAPPFLHGYSATPVIDRDCLDETLDAMLDWIAADERLPKIVALDAMATDGPIMKALTRVLAARGKAPRILDRSLRPKLKSDLDGKNYLEQALSSSTRKKLRQHRRRLSERGDLSSVIIHDPQAVRDALEHFLQMEASGWKGRQGTALLCSDADAAFARTAVGALSEQGRACIHALTLDRRPVSMQIVLRAGPAAFTWKIAYDETLHDVSPGMLLLEDYTAAFLNDPAIASVNSCTYDDKSFMSVWTERESIANLWIDARRGGSVSFELLWRLQKGYCGLRAMVKNAYLKPRRAQPRKRSA